MPLCILSTFVYQLVFPFFNVNYRYLIDKFQSAYRCGHSTEIALLRVFNYIVIMAGNETGYT